MHRGLIIRKNPGALIAKEYLEKAIAGMTCVGAAVATVGDDKKPTLLCQYLNEAPTVAGLEEAQNTFKDDGIVFFLGEFPKGTNTEEIQPFALLADDKDQNLAVLFLEGDFVGFEKGGSSHSAEYNCAETLLGPMIAKMFNGSGQDLVKFNAELDEPLTETLIKQSYANRGTVCILTQDGKLHTWGDNELRKDYPWGWTSQHLGFEAEAPKKVEEPKPQASGRKLFGSGKPVIASTESIPQPKPDTALPPEKSGPIKEAEKNGQAAAGTHYGAPPTSITKNSDIKTWYRQNSLDGNCPQNWKQRPNVKIKPPKGMDALAAHPAANGQQQSPAIKAGAEALPVMSKDELGKLKTFVDTGPAKVLKDRVGDKWDPAAIQKREEKLPTFEENSGKKLEETFNWDYGLLVQLGKDVGIPALAQLALAYRKAYMISLSEETPAATPAATPADKPATPAAPPAPADKPAEAAPAAKRKLFGKAA
jgi:hypothetical protein